MAASIYQPSYFQPQNINGVPLAGAKLYFYITATTTPITVYQDAAMATPHANPVVADASGLFPPIFVEQDIFKVVLKTSADVTIQTVDPMTKGFGDQSALIIRQFLDVFPYVDTRTQLKAIDTGEETTAYLRENGRSGMFNFRLGNYAALVAADTGEVLYIKADAVATSTGAWVRDFDPNFVSSRTILKGIDPDIHPSVILRESGREGTFHFRAGDYTARIGADALEGIYIKANSKLASAGAWVRVVDYAVKPGWWGAVSGSGTDDKLPLQAAMALDYPLHIDGNYRTSDALEYSGTGSKLVFGDGSKTSLLTMTSATQNLFVKTGGGPITLRDMGFTTTVDKTAGAVLASTSDGRDLVQNCHFYGGGVSTMLWNALSFDSLIPIVDGCYFLNIKNVCVVMQRSAGGTAGSEGVVRDCVFNTGTPTNPSINGSTAVYWISGLGTQRVHNCLIQNYDYGVVASPVSSVSKGSLLVNGCAFEGMDIVAVNISLPAASAAAMQSVSVSNCEFNIPSPGRVLVAAGATNPDFLENIAFTGNTVFCGVAGAVAVQAGFALVTGGNIFYGITDIVPIALAAANPDNTLFGGDLFVNITTGYALNANTGAKKLDRSAA